MGPPILLSSVVEPPDRRKKDDDLFHNKSISECLWACPEKQNNPQTMSEFPEGLPANIHIVQTKKRSKSKERINLPNMDPPEHRRCTSVPIDAHGGGRRRSRSADSSRVWTVDRRAFLAELQRKRRANVNRARAEAGVEARAEARAEALKEKISAAREEAKEGEDVRDKEKGDPSRRRASLTRPREEAEDDENEDEERRGKKTRGKGHPAYKRRKSDPPLFFLDDDSGGSDSSDDGREGAFRNVVVDPSQSRPPPRDDGSLDEGSRRPTRRSLGTVANSGEVSADEGRLRQRRSRRQRGRRDGDLRKSAPGGFVGRDRSKSPAPAAVAAAGAVEDGTRRQSFPSGSRGEKLATVPPGHVGDEPRRRIRLAHSRGDGNRRSSAGGGASGIRDGNRRSSTGGGAGGSGGPGFGGNVLHSESFQRSPSRENRGLDRGQSPPKEDRSSDRTPSSPPGSPPPRDKEMTARTSMLKDKDILAMAEVPVGKEARDNGTRHDVDDKLRQENAILRDRIRALTGERNRMNVTIDALKAQLRLTQGKAKSLKNELRCARQELSAGNQSGESAASDDDVDNDEEMIDELGRLRVELKNARAVIRVKSQQLEEAEGDVRRLEQEAGGAGNIKIAERPLPAGVDAFESRSGSGSETICEMEEVILAKEFALCAARTEIANLRQQLDGRTDDLDRQDEGGTFEEGDSEEEEPTSKEEEGREELKECDAELDLRKKLAALEVENRQLKERLSAPND